MFSRADALVQQHHENAFRVRPIEPLKFSRRLQRSGAPPDLPAARPNKRAGLRVPLRSWNEAAQDIDRLAAKSKLQRRRIAEGQKFISRAKPRGESRQRSLLAHAQRTGCPDGSQRVEKSCLFLEASQTQHGAIRGKLIHRRPLSIRRLFRGIRHASCRSIWGPSADRRGYWYRPHGHATGLKAACTKGQKHD